MEKDNIDPTRVLDGWRPAAPPPMPELDFSGLFQHLHAEPPAQGHQRLDPVRVARLKKRGFEMSDVEDIDVPEIELPRIKPPVALDDRALDEALRAASHLAQAQGPLSDAGVALDPPPSGPAIEPRLLARWQPGAWIAVRRRALGASTEVVMTPQGPLVETLAPQWLMAVWPPQRVDQPLLGRWPEQAMLCAANDDDTAARRLLRQAVPVEASLWIADLDVDWALLAELVLHHDTALQPFQLKALRGLAEAERLAQFERLNTAYDSATAEQPLRLKRKSR